MQAITEGTGGSDPSADATRDLGLRIIKFRLGQYVVDVLVDRLGTFRGIARITSTPSPTQRLASRSLATRDDVEQYYDTSEP